MLERDVILSKISIIRNCLNRIVKATRLDPSTLEEFYRQILDKLNASPAAAGPPE